MCIVSNLGDYAKDSWPKKWPAILPPSNPPWGPSAFPNQPYNPFPTPTINLPEKELQRQIDELREEFKAMKEMLKQAKIYDEKFNEPECELDEKVEFLKKVAVLVGIDLEDIFERKV
jgi:hypothetical protein